MKHFFIFSIFLFIGTLFFGANAQSGPLPAPEGPLSCVLDEETSCDEFSFFLNWETAAVPLDTTKYATSVECESPDGSLSEEVSAGTSECADNPDLGCLDNLSTQICIDSSLFSLAESDWICTAKVRGLHPPTIGRPATRGSKRQNSPNNSGGGNHAQATVGCENPF